ncbi:MAG: hypothetical protein U0792_13075 [Gemmataceae bacterium]
MNIWGRVPRSRDITIDSWPSHRTSARRPSPTSTSLNGEGVVIEPFARTEGRGRRIAFEERWDDLAADRGDAEDVAVAVGQVHVQDRKGEPSVVNREPRSTGTRISGKHRHMRLAHALQPVAASPRAGFAIHPD